MNVSNESDFGTPEQQKQGGGITKGYTADGAKVARVKHQCAFDRYYVYNYITDKQYDAGERLKYDAYLAGMFPYIKSSADFSIKGNRLDDPTIVMIDARTRFNNAFRSLDRYEAAIASLVIVEDGYLKWVTDQKLRLNAMNILRSALDTLVKHYRM